MAHKLAAFALAASIALASMAAAQTVDPNATSGATDAPVATEQQLRVRNRTTIPPGAPTTQEMRRVCAWRSDGGVVTGRHMRLPLGIDIRQCAVSQSRALGSACRCGNRTGNVIEVPV
jgi:hypothetical protein